MRAYRPSFVGGQGYSEEFEQVREEKLRIYSDRAQAGLPLFEPIVGPQPIDSPVDNFLDSTGL